jgi:hypothetical protein
LLGVSSLLYCTVRRGCVLAGSWVVVRVLAFVGGCAILHLVVFKFFALGFYTYFMVCLVRHQVCEARFSLLRFATCSNFFMVCISIHAKPGYLLQGTLVLTSWCVCWLQTCEAEFLLYKGYRAVYAGLILLFIPASCYATERSRVTRPGVYFLLPGKLFFSTWRVMAVGVGGQCLCKVPRLCLW